MIEAPVMKELKETANTCITNVLHTGNNTHVQVTVH